MRDSRLTFRPSRAMTPSYRPPPFLGDSRGIDVRPATAAVTAADPRI